MLNNRRSAGSESDRGAPAGDAHSTQIRAARAQFEAARHRLQNQPVKEHLVDATIPDEALRGYTLLRELHRGGQGTVYLAIQKSTDRYVAVKIFNPGRVGGSSVVATGLARFEREVEALSLLKHPNIVTIHDCGRHLDHVYLVMDYVDGRPLDEHVASLRLSLRQVVELFARVCDGVNTAHLRGVIHRDLKPGNILVDAHGEPHVLDFGLAKLADDSSESGPEMVTMTATGQFVGSLPWASPEQAEGRADELDIRTDVYSLGVVLYQALTGRFPYPITGRLVEVVRNIAGTDPVRPSSVRREIDRELETILLKALAKEPQRRYQNAGELARDLRRYLADEPIEARRDSLAYVMSKQLARFRVAAAACGIVLLTVSGALAVSVAAWRQAEQQRGIAEDLGKRADAEASQARAVTEFMREVLTSADPDNQGADVRLAQVLERASAGASQRFAGFPAREAEVRELLGQVFMKLTLASAAQAEFDRARRLWRESVGADDPRTLISDSWFASAALYLNQPDVAEHVLEDLVPRMERVLGRDHPTTLGTLRDVAAVYLHRGRLEEAERILNELRAHPAIADDDRQQIRVVSGLIAASEQRMTARADDGRVELARKCEELAREWTVRSERLFGADSAMTLAPQLTLAEMLLHQGKCAAAAVICRRILSDERLGEAHLVRINAMFTLADALGRLGEADEPAELHARRIELMRPQYAANIPVFLAQLGHALPYLDRGGRALEGEALARELSTTLLSHGGGHDDIAFDAELYVAHFVSMQGRLDEADALFAALRSPETSLRGRHTRARLHMFSAAHLLRRGRPDEAEDELQQAVACMGDARRGTWDTQPDDLILAHIELYRAQGRRDKVDEYERLRREIVRCAAENQ